MGFGPNYKSVDDKTIHDLREQFQGMMVVIIDEMSMVSPDTLYNVHRRLTEITRCDDIMGDRGFLLVGDLLQIPPVKSGKKVFEEPSNPENYCLFNSSDNLWESCQTVTLLVNQRQGVSEWTNTLNRIRMGEQNEEDEDLLNTRRLSNFKNAKINFNDATYAFYSNDEVLAHNNKMLNELRGNLVSAMAEIQGYPKGVEPPIKHGKVADSTFFKKLELKKGAKAMLNYNIKIIDNLVNGVGCKIVDFVYK